jgi:GntR family transcriptional regulator/MocR family aminotransferase
MPVDRLGANVDAAIRSGSTPRLVYVTPAHQFPLGSALSLPRRLALLEHAHQHAFHVVEDDYDGEFRYNARPLGSLQSLDRHGRVIYAGSFNKVLFSSLRLGYIVLPPDLVDRFLRLRDAVDRFPPTIEQAVLADFLREGYFERHLRQSRTACIARRDALFAAAERHLHGLLELQSADAGFHVVGLLPKRLPDTTAELRAAEHDVDVTALSGYHVGKPRLNGLLLGFAASKPASITAAVERLARALKGFAQA